MTSQTWQAAAHPRGFHPIALYLILTAAFSSPFWALMILAGDIGAGDAGYVYLMMWGPALGALATVKLKRMNPADLGFRWGNGRYAALSYALPIGYGLIAYVAIWTTSFGSFPNTSFITAAAARLGWTITDPVLFVPLFILLTGTSAVIGGTAAGLGEEIGWRGFLAPQLTHSVGFTRAALFGGVIWACWHYPIILFANYRAATPLWFSLPCFTIMVIALSVIMLWFRLASGSVWPAAILHGVHNVFIQQIFTPLTARTGTTTDYAIDEFGFAVPAVTSVLAFVFWLRRDQAIRIMDRRLQSGEGM